MPVAKGYSILIFLVKIVLNIWSSPFSLQDIKQHFYLKEILFREKESRWWKSFQDSKTTWRI